jgi:hypothetical protein
VALETFENTKGAPLKKNDPIEIAVVYDNFSKEWFNDATVAAMVYMARSNQVPATSLRPSSDGNRTENQPSISATAAQKILF